MPTDTKKATFVKDVYTAFFGRTDFRIYGLLIKIQVIFFSYARV